MHFTYLDSQLQALITEAVILNDASPTYSRSGNATNPDTGSSVGANTRIRRSVVVGGQTCQFDLMEVASTNLATALTTGTYTTTTTKAHTVWWDGGAGDYTITTSGSAIIGDTLQTADGRNFVVLMNVTSGDTITCTRSGSPTNTHLQVEAWYHPTGKIALNSSRSSATLATTGRSFGDVGTIVAIAQPYGWSYDQEFYNADSNANGWTLLRGSNGGINSMWITQSSFKHCVYCARFWSGGSGSRQQNHGFMDGKYRLLKLSWSTTNGIGVESSAWDFEEVTDLGSAPVGDIAATAPFTNDTGMNIGCWAPGGGRQFNGWVLLLHYTRVLSQNEILLLKDAFEQPAGQQRLLAAWGDSETQYQASADWPSLVYINQFLDGHLWNGGVGGETVAQVSTRFMGKAHLWQGFQTFWDQNSLDLSGMQGMVNKLGHSNYIMMSTVNSTSQGVGSAGYNSIIAYNASLLSTFGAKNYLDIRSLMIALNDPATDSTDTTNDWAGTSMRADAIHYNTTVGHPRIAGFVASKFWAMINGYTNITYGVSVTTVLGTEYILLPAPGTGKRIVLIAVMAYNTGGSAEGYYIYRGPVSSGSISTKTYILGSKAGTGSTSTAISVNNNTQNAQWAYPGGLFLPENQALAVQVRDGGKHVQCVAFGYIANYP